MKHFCSKCGKPVKGRRGCCPNCRKKILEETNDNRSEEQKIEIEYPQKEEKIFSA